METSRTVNETDYGLYGSLLSDSMTMNLKNINVGIILFQNEEDMKIFTLMFEKPKISQITGVLSFSFSDAEPKRCDWLRTDKDPD